MSRVYTIGETVFDIIFENSKPIVGKAGGAMLNASVSLGRLGIPVSFISEIGKDKIGKTILSFLEQNNINTDYLYKFEEGSTAIALAFLDEYKNADYEFIKQYPDQRIDISLPEVRENDIVLFGSFFAITKEVIKKLTKFIKKAKKSGAIVLYDPNFRRSHLKDLHIYKDYIIENISNSSIVRGSNEDFRFIFDTDDPHEVFDIIRNYGSEILIFTSGAGNIEFISKDLNFSVPAKKINPISTIGAGDTFNAGIIYGLYKNEITISQIHQINIGLWKNIIETAIKFSTIVCLSWDNYIGKQIISNNDV